jgi:hypothetical protein
VTLTGYKTTVASSSPSPAFATLIGPFSQAQDELGTTFHRGAPQEIDKQTVILLSLPSYKEHFVIADRPIALTDQDPQLVAVLPEEGPCIWEGHFAIHTGPFLAVSDDDHHSYRCGEPLEICSKTLKVLQHPRYQSSFGTINRAQEGTTVEPVICGTSTECC